MRNAILSFVRRAISDERGQALPIVAVSMLALLGMSGLVIDVGHAYVVRGQLQNSANAAALAAAGYVYTSNSASVNVISIAKQYDTAPGEENYYSQGTVTTSVTTKCLNMLMPVGQICGSSPIPNAVVVKNSLSVPTYFLRLFGVSTLNVSATATASMQGQANPWNVAIIVDGTESMSTTDTNCGSLSEFHCALSGVQTFLAATNPCAPGATSCTPATAQLRVALFTFPNFVTTNLNNANFCNSPGFTYTTKPYTLPTTSATTYSSIQYTGATPMTATYQVTAWDSGYYAPSSASTSGLNATDNLIEVIGYGYNSSTGAIAHEGCLPDVGGESTYYGGVIYAAKAALLQEQALYPNSKNALILLSDGQAQATQSKFPANSSTPTPATAGIAVTSNGSKTTNLTGAANSFGLYPDYNDECQQAIMAAQSASAAGIRVYAVAYGSEDSGCGVGGTDTTLVATGQNASFAVSALTPCVTMENIASSLSYFYSDYNKSGSGSTCQDASHSVSTLAQIFLSISADFTKPRLLPNNAT